MEYDLKENIKKIIRWSFNYLPVSILKKISSVYPRLFAFFPPNHQFLYKKYLGSVILHIDTKYPIEKGIISGRYDPPTFLMIDRIVKLGDICIDVGANFGAIAFALAKKVEKNGKVYAFEPGQIPFKRLLANIELNNNIKDRIIPINMGLSDHVSCLFWKQHDGMPGNGSIIETQEPNSLPISVTTIDEYFKEINIERIDLVKIDVESMEYEVIKGGIKTFGKYFPIIYYETIKAFEKERKKPIFQYIENILSEIGYMFYKVEPDGNFKKTNYPDLSSNTLAIPVSKNQVISCI